MSLQILGRLGRSPWAAGLAVCGVVLAAIFAGHEPLRAAQIALLALPFFVWLRWPLSSRGWRAARWITVSAVVALFVIDGLVRAYLRSRYQALPDSSLVLAAVANTTTREALEYLKSQGVAIGIAMAGLLAALSLTTAWVAVCNRHTVAVGRMGRRVLILLLIAGSVGYISKPWRRHHPALFWPTWAASVDDLRDSWSDQARQRAQLMSNARAANPSLTAAGPSTVVLVLTDSVNRDNMSLYGYGRDTTPQLTALSREEAGRWLTLRHAWSVEPGTVASLSGIFSFGARDQDDPVGHSQHILALARAAGYRVWWMSNHDDVAIDQQHAQLADTVEMINREPGRSTSSLDGELLDCLEEALVDAAPRKLIVVHLLGAHPHYRLRAPSAMRPFDEGGDAVEAQMEKAGRPVWLRELRQTYDAALRYHDGVVAETARLTRRHAPAGGQAAWMFLSDHGQEVGHDIVHAGHSPGTAAGYRVPMLLWRSTQPWPSDLGQRPFRADWAAWTLADLLNLQWQTMTAERNVLHPDYRWEAPALPVASVRFDR
ncbi:phosphoethanolamine transferase [Roseateles amylovorans]|uniref:Phosphoethanolamine transferase n=1 Tax=Roseateles amylovorans TaxID=2978473 RepID=A0ABY6AW25_9BURK|nr:phosphoethanolamine transferase [Roseateles amylovorans]UXH76599.1 phosphoethanolamine transferase [Roseateles amylovorans]